MSAKHTPGPWSVFKPALGHDRELCVAQEAGDTHVATCHHTDTSEREEANARLISAAPELREALAELLLEIDRAEGYITDVMQRVPCDSIERARAAIAKATGGQP